MGNADWKDWSDGWIKNGHFLSYRKAMIIYYEHVSRRELSHYEWDWSDAEGHAQAIPALDSRGPVIPSFLEVTQEYDPDTKENRIWQLIFGLSAQALIYIQLPADTDRHGLPKIPKPRDDMRRVCHFEDWMSPFDEPTFLTEHFMMRPGLDRIAFEAYNPNEQAIQAGDFTLNFFVNRMVTERVGTVKNGVLSPTSDRWRETLDKLYKRLIPVRPITLYPVQAAAEAHH